MSLNSGSSSSAFTSSSSSQLRTTVPRCQALKMPGDVLDDVLARIQQLVAFGPRLHQRVLDAVVHHLRVVPGADLAGVDESLVARTLRSQRVEHRHRALDVVLLAAGHQPVAVLLTPDPAGDAAIHEVDALLGAAAPACIASSVNRELPPR